MKYIWYFIIILIIYTIYKRFVSPIYESFKKGGRLRNIPYHTILIFNESLFTRRRIHGISMKIFNVRKLLLPILSLLGHFCSIFPWPFLKYTYSVLSITYMSTYYFFFWNTVSFSYIY